MDTQLIVKEIQSPALKDVLKEMDALKRKLEAGKLTIEDYKIEIDLVKKTIQVIALDWTFNKKTTPRGKLLLNQG